MSYRIIWQPAAERVPGRLPRDVQARLLSRVDELTEYPRPTGVRRTEGRERFYRVRVGQYRIVYDVIDRDLLISVERIGHRRDVYRRTQADDDA